METFKTIDECFYLIQNGANIKQGQINGGYPITRIETISNDKFNRDKVGYAGIFELGKYASYVLEDGDLLMSHINSPQYLGRTVLYKKKDSEIIIHGMNLLRLKANVEIINPGFARYLFYSVPFRRQIAKITKKSVNQASFSINDLKKVSIVIPSLSVQEKIVKKLNSAISVRNYYEKQIELLDELVKARFVEMFGNPVTNDMLWNIDVLKDICTKIGSGSTPRGGKESYIDEGISLIRSMNVHNAYFEYKDLAHITLDQAEKLNNVVVEYDDLLFNITGASVARCCVVPSDVLPARVNQHVCILRCREKINPIFLQRLLVNENYQGKLLQIAKSGATREAINKQQLESLEIMIPPLELQNQFASFVKEIDKSRSRIQKSLEASQELFDSLMQEYFG